MGSKIPAKRKPQRPPGEAVREELRNEGEGNKTADRNYREATRDFVESPRGQREIGKAGEVTPEEETEIRRAEEEAKGHAREHDPAEVRDRSRPS
jgi:hypothetical protein